MSTARFQSVNDLINQVAVESGLSPVTDVLAVSDDAFVQLKYLLNACLQELMELHPWQILSRQFQYTTVGNEEGKLDLPSDFAYMTDQTGWDRANNVPLAGPLSPQDWTYLLGRDLVGSTIYASFRFEQNQLWIFPQNPMPQGLDINFEYTSRNFIQQAGVIPVEYSDTIITSADTVLVPPQLIQRLLKVKFLEAKGFDSQKAEDNFWQSFNSWTGKDNSAPILSMGNGFRGVPYLDGFYNTPDSHFGGAR